MSTLNEDDEKLMTKISLCRATIYATVGVAIKNGVVGHPVFIFPKDHQNINEGVFNFAGETLEELGFRLERVFDSGSEKGIVRVAIWKNSLFK